MRTIIFSLICILISLNVFSQPIPADSLYLGQVPPGYQPKVFLLPVNGALRPIERISITADGKEIYFGQLNSYPPSVTKIFYYRYTDNRWQGPFELFSGYIAPSLSPNDSILITQTSINYYTAISYFSLRTPTGWTAPVQLFHFTQQSHYTNLSGLNNYYTSSSFGGSSYRDISRVMMTGLDTTVVSLGMPISTSLDESDFFVARNEAYIIHARHTSSVAGDLFISYKKTNGRWTNSKPLGSHINLPNPTWEYGPFVTHDGKYLFFTRGDNSWNSYLTYWVRIDNIIDSLKFTNYTPYLLNQIPNQTDSINKPFSYTFSDTAFIDDDGNNTLTYSASLSNGSSLPDWLHFEPQTRTFWGTPGAISQLNIKITATDTAGAVANSIFTLDIINPIGIEPINTNEVKSFSLKQNYPNPFNPKTEIIFDVASLSDTKLTVYDICGNEIVKLVNRVLKSGRYKVEFDAGNLSSGIYFYKLEAGSYIQTRKMVIIK